MHENEKRQLKVPNALPHKLCGLYESHKGIYLRPGDINANAYNLAKLIYMVLSPFSTTF